jgi:F0F1-type ATP synthase assembly protein I
MIKIFENEEEGAKSKPDNKASLSLNLEPDTPSEPVDPPVEAASLPDEAPQVEPPIEALAENHVPSVADPAFDGEPDIASASPWEKIDEPSVRARVEETPAREYPPFYREQTLPPIPEAPVEFAVPEPPEQQTVSANPPDAPNFREEKNERELFAKTPYTPPTQEENIRNTGLAWNAGIIFFGSVGFMLILGWGADLLLGTSPWGLVGGVIFGSLIGFIQFFRISSQIFRK